MKAHTIDFATKQYGHTGLSGDHYVAHMGARELLMSLEAILEATGGRGSTVCQRSIPKSDYIANGIIKDRKLPIWTIVIALYDEYAVQDDGTFQFPKDEKEAAAAVNKIGFLDGQTRIHSCKKIFEAMPMLQDIPVNVMIVNNPTVEDVEDIFFTMNALRKEVDKDFCFRLMYRLRLLNPHQNEAYEMLVRANEDEDHPLCGKIKFADGSGISSKTLVDYMCNESNDVIAQYSRRYHSPEARYQVFKRFWKSVEAENAKDCTGGKVIGPDGRVKTMRAQRLATIGAMSGTIIELMVDKGITATQQNIRNYYRTWVHDVLGVSHVVLSDNGTQEYFDNTGRKVDVVKDRWNGKRKALSAIQSDYTLLKLAMEKNLTAEEVSVNA